MDARTVCRRAVAIVAGVALAAAAPVSANDVLPGLDLWETPAGVASHNFTGTPIPADFFDPGSDPFVGTVPLQGAPLQTNPPGAFGFADTVVERPAPAILPACPSEDTVPIQIVALNLVSSQPITVTYNGGQNPELWDVQVCLSDLPQPQGSITIRHECPDPAGGTFDSNLPVQPKFVFTRQSDLMTRTLDAGVFGFTPLQINANDVGWVHVPDPIFGVTTAAPGADWDANCDGAFDGPSALGTSNFAAGIWSIPCTCAGAGNQRKRVTGEAGLWASHGVKIAEETSTADFDTDGHADIYDNCVNVPNPDQADADNDTVGDVCDNCPDTYNPLQEDANSNGIGDACESPIPTVSEWGMIVLGVLVLATGVVFVRRRLDPMAG